MNSEPTASSAVAIAWRSRRAITGARVCGVRALQVSLLALGLGSATSAVPLEYRWERLLEAEPREIRVVAVTARELRRVERRYGSAGMPRREVLGAGKAHKGFALLYRNGGELYCRIYLTALADVETLTHELRHCLGWIH